MRRGDRAVHAQRRCEAAEATEVQAWLVGKKGRGSLDGSGFPRLSLISLSTRNPSIICALGIFFNFQKYKKMKDNI